MGKLKEYLMTIKTKNKIGFIPPPVGYNDAYDENNKYLTIWCCECDKTIPARLTKGDEIYPHKKNLHKLPFWKCDTCGNYVGCHHKTNNPTKPLGTIPSPELRKMKMTIHINIDRLIREFNLTKKHIYKVLSKHMGKEFHCGELSTIKEAYKALAKIRSMIRNLI